MWNKRNHAFFRFQAKRNFRFNFNFRFRSENEGLPYPIGTNRKKRRRELNYTTEIKKHTQRELSTKRL
jgi:hypothetical protein